MLKNEKIISIDKNYYDMIQNVTVLFNVNVNHTVTNSVTLYCYTFYHVLPPILKTFEWDFRFQFSMLTEPGYQGRTATKRRIGR